MRKCREARSVCRVVAPVNITRLEAFIGRVTNDEH